VGLNWASYYNRDIRERS